MVVGGALHRASPCKPACRRVPPGAAGQLGSLLLQLLRQVLRRVPRQLPVGLLLRVQLPRQLLAALAPQRLGAQLAREAGHVGRVVRTAPAHRGRERKLRGSWRGWGLGCRGLLWQNGRLLVG